MRESAAYVGCRRRYPRGADVDAARATFLPSATSSREKFVSNPGSNAPTLSVQAEPSRALSLPLQDRVSSALRCVALYFIEELLDAISCILPLVVEEA